MRMQLVTFMVLLFICPGQGITLRNNEKAKKKTHHSNETSPTKGPTFYIMERGKAKPESMKSFLIKYNGSVDEVTVKGLVETYIVEANREGVNYEVAFCQMCLETGFLKFEGSVSKYQHNYCGLGCIDMFSRGDWFSSMEEGVRAHIQHLKAYASLEPVRSPLVDPRFSSVPRGTVKVVAELTGKWATDPDYGRKISALISRLNSL